MGGEIGAKVGDLLAGQAKMDSELGGATCRLFEELQHERCLSCTLEFVAFEALVAFTEFAEAFAVDVAHMGGHLVRLLGGEKEIPSDDLKPEQIHQLGLTCVLTDPFGGDTADIECDNTRIAQIKTGGPVQCRIFADERVNITPEDFKARFTA